ncbi:MAG: hypothetical protein RIR48_2336 [Bacteroidota bacterium]
MAQIKNIDMKIDISVIIPMFNAEKYIESTVNSILQQEVHHFSVELIIIDDKSDDNSCEIVKKLNHPKITLIELKQKGGTAHARNVGINVANGEWIQFLDSDDKVCSDLFKKFELSKKPGVNCYLFSIEHEYKNYFLRQTIQKISDKRAFGHFGSVCNKFIKRELCVKFKENYLFEDTIFIIDVFINSELCLGLIDDAYYKYFRNNPNSIIANFSSNEFYKMYRYIFSQIEKCDDKTKMFILETFLAIAVRRDINIFIRMRIVSTILAKLYWYLPAVLMDQNRTKVKNMMSKYSFQVIR